MISVKDAVIIALIVLSTTTAIRDVARISSRRARQQRVRQIKKPQRRELRL